jgi:hypothetical protein
MRCGVVLFAALLLETFAGCSVAIDADDIDQGCAAGEKLCEGECVRTDDPAYGCTSNLCDPCLRKNAIPKCDEANRCVVAACLDGFGCALDEVGCDVNILIDKLNCGGCGTRCDAGYSCRLGKCEPASDAG